MRAGTIGTKAALAAIPVTLFVATSRAASSPDVGPETADAQSSLAIRAGKACPILPESGVMPAAPWEQKIEQAANIIVAKDRTLRLALPLIDFPSQFESKSRKDRAVEIKG